MIYKFESKRDELYLKNYLSLNKAITHAGGNGEMIISKMAEDLLDTLARNNIQISAEYIEELKDSV